jgi:hypothetical protein
MSTLNQDARRAKDAVEDLAEQARRVEHAANFSGSDATGIEILPSGQLLLLDMPEANEGAELLMSTDDRRDKYPLSTIERDQERLQSIIHLIAADAPLRFICRAHRVGWHTLESIRAKQGTKIAAVKKVIAQRMATFAQLGIETLLDDLAAGRLDSDKLGVTLGIIVDKMQILTGEATSIVQHQDTAPKITAETLREKLAGMKRALPTGSSGEEFPQQAAAAPAALVIEGQIDTQSTV